MSRQPAVTPPPLPRPTLIDWLFLLTGCGASLLLSTLPSPRPEPAGAAFDSVWLGRLATTLPALMHLPEGVILLGPFFYLGQRLLGRAPGITTGEWLWIFAWPGVALVNGLAAWRLAIDSGATALPDFLAPHAVYLFYWPAMVWYVLLVPSLAVVALLVGLFGMFGRTPPWTHSLGVVLVVWPVVPLAGILALVHAGLLVAPKPL